MTGGTLGLGSRDDPELLVGYPDHVARAELTPPAGLWFAVHQHLVVGEES